MGGRHSSVVSSAPTILQPLGSNPKQTIHTCFQFVLKLLREKNKNKQN